MKFPHAGLSAKSIAELAFIHSRVSRRQLAAFQRPSAESLKQFWQSSRGLERRWMNLLEQENPAASPSVESIERLAPRVFTSEIVVRIWSTLLAALDAQQPDEDLIRLARSVVGSYVRVRTEILSRLLKTPNEQQIRSTNIDQLRRRCERWNDLLLGPVAVQTNCFEFAFNAERARDFGEEMISADSSTRLNAAEHLVSAGLHLTFGPRLSDESFDEPELIGLMQSMVSNFPHDVLRHDGSLRTLLQQRIIAGRGNSDRQIVGEGSENGTTTIPLFPFKSSSTNVFRFDK